MKEKWCASPNCTYINRNFSSEQRRLLVCLATNGETRSVNFCLCTASSALVRHACTLPSSAEFKADISSPREQLQSNSKQSHRPSALPRYQGQHILQQELKFSFMIPWKANSILQETQLFPTTVRAATVQWMYCPSGPTNTTLLWMPFMMLT